MSPTVPLREPRPQDRWVDASEVRRGLIRGELMRVHRRLSDQVGVVERLLARDALEPCELRSAARELAHLAFRVRDLAHEHGALTDVLTDR